MSSFGLFFTQIPRLFWSEYSSRPFVHCIDCDVPLVESSAYVVQKRYVGKEAVFEMAMCDGCRERMTKEYSAETKENITRFMNEQFQNRAAESLDDNETGIIEMREIEDPEDGAALLQDCVDRCVICSTERDKCHRYSVAGLCRASEIVVQVSPISRTPLMVCEKCELGMAELISKQTRDSWERFIDEHFDGPPGIEVDSPNSYPLAF